MTPVFAASYSGLFKTFVDVLEPDALAGKPVLLAATAGTARHSLVIEHAMRPLFSYLRALIVPTGVFAAPEDWAGGDTTPLATRIERAAGELADLMTSRAPARGRRPVRRPDPVREASWPTARRCSPPPSGCRGRTPRSRRAAPMTVNARTLTGFLSRARATITPTAAMAIAAPAWPGIDVRVSSWIWSRNQPTTRHPAAHRSSQICRPVGVWKPRIAAATSTRRRKAPPTRLRIFMSASPLAAPLCVKNQYGTMGRRWGGIDTSDHKAGPTTSWSGPLAWFLSCRRAGQHTVRVEDEFWAAPLSKSA